MPSYSNSSAMRSGIEAQFNFLTELTRKTFDSMRKLGELNLHFTQQVMHDGAEAARQLVSCRDPLQFAAVAAGATQPALQNLQRYQQQLAGMLAGAQLDLTRSAEAFMPEGARYAAAAALVQEVARETSSAVDPWSAAFDGDGASGDPFSSAARGNGSSPDSTGGGNHYTRG